MSTYTAHIDTFARDRLPPSELWPELRFDLPELQYADKLNCAAALLDDAVAEGHGARIAVYGSSEQLTYSALQERANRIANVLVHQMGLVPGNRVLLRGANSPMLAALWFGVMKAGGIAVTTMPMLRAGELVKVAAKGEIDYAFCAGALAEDLRAAAATTGRLKQIVTYGDGDLEARMQRASANFTTVPTAADDVCLLAFTSGTTGNPKATMHFHRDVLAMADVVGRHLLETQPNDIYVGSPPLGFTFGLGALLVFPLRFRAAAILLDPVSPDALLAAIARFRATCLFTAPTMYRNLAARVAGYDLSSLRKCVSAGEPLPLATSDLWHATTGIRLIDGIGATEMIHIFIGARGADIRPGATGKPLPGYQACILDDNNQPLPAGSIGRLAVKGPTGCRYLADERQTQYVIDGWNVTGDQYRLDEDGYFWFIARSDDMIISAGYNISGAEVEATLMQHAAVRECAVVAAPDTQRGQVAKAFVVLNNGTAPCPALATQLQDFVKATIAPYKYPRIVEFITELPRTPTGKVQRYVLRTMNAEPKSEQA
jgi:2-aminobenzoate-CoA ligase